MAVSIPSATTDMPSSCASEMVARMIFHASISISQATTNDLSIFSSVNGRRISESSDEWPVPKSSIARPIPLMRNRVSTSAASTGSAMIMLSVISAISAEGARSARRSMSSIWSGSAGLASAKGEMFTATPQPG